MDIAEFNRELNHSSEVVRLAGGEGVAAEQQRLRNLLPQVDEEERTWADQMIDLLPELTAPPPPPSPLMLEAMKIQQAACATRGTREETRAALAAGRKKIWQIADSAPKDESAHIRGLTRTIDHLEEALDDPFWEFPSPRADHSE
jgi:hypothetical protein